MQTLFIISLSAFAVAALAWFNTWAFWLHPPEGWLGKEVVAVTPLCENEKVRHALWFRRLKMITLLLGLISSALFVALIVDHIR
jgi:hypothetical protein